MDDYYCEENIDDILSKEDIKKYNSDTNTLEKYKFLLKKYYLLVLEMACMTFLLLKNAYT